ncbi:hypothetical protein JHK87_051119 [Glycine soja]|nr:hypothetical protein JHK87_051119 [Glycine soja]
MSEVPALAVLSMTGSQNIHEFQCQGAFAWTIEYRRGACCCLWYSCNWFIIQQGSWNDVFKVAVALYIVGTLVWNIFSTGEKVLD